MHLIFLADIDFFGHNSGSILIKDLLKEFDKKKFKLQQYFLVIQYLKKPRFFLARTAR